MQIAYTDIIEAVEAARQSPYSIWAELAAKTLGKPADAVTGAEADAARAAYFTAQHEQTSPAIAKDVQDSPCHLTGEQKAELQDIIWHIQDLNEQSDTIDEKLARAHDEHLTRIYRWFEDNLPEFLTTDSESFADDPGYPNV